MTEFVLYVKETLRLGISKGLRHDISALGLSNAKYDLL
jgi:hypothetical protein